MKKVELEQFLDTGWMNESTLYYKGYIYWCEACSYPGDGHDGQFHFFVRRYRGRNNANGTCSPYLTPDKKYLEGGDCLNLYGTDEDEVKLRFLKSPIFEGKTF